MSAQTLQPLPPVDCHVHLVGNGKSGSGCWLRLGATWWQKMLANHMLRHIGLGATSLHASDFDERYVAHLLKLVRESSLASVVLLAQDEVFHDDGTKMEGTGSFHVPNDYVLRLAREHPEFLPAVSIHPARPDALDELDRCIQGGAVMLKLLPNCHNVDCNHPRYRKFWERMAEVRLPLLAHTGGEHTVQVVNAAYSDPRVLTLPLECGVTVIAAHAATKSGLTDPQYFHVFADMLGKWPNLHGDTHGMSRSADASQNAASATQTCSANASCTAAISRCRSPAYGRSCVEAFHSPTTSAAAKSQTCSSGTTS